MKLKKMIVFILMAGMLLFGVGLGNDDVAEAATGTWKQNSTGWRYKYSDGSYLKNDWLKSGGKWYHFDANGYMQTGWQKIGKWYYFSSAGVMQTGWRQIKGAWYYFSSSGVLQTGWKKISKKWYYFKSDGTMATGWIEDKGLEYYMLDDGTLMTDKLFVDDEYVYLFTDDCYVQGYSKVTGSLMFMTESVYYKNSNLIVTGYYFNSSEDRTLKKYQTCDLMVYDSSDELVASAPVNGPVTLQLKPFCYYTEREVFTIPRGSIYNMSADFSTFSATVGFKGMKWE